MPRDRSSKKAKFSEENGESKSASAPVASRPSARDSESIESDFSPLRRAERPPVRHQGSPPPARHQASPPLVEERPSRTREPSDPARRTSASKDDLRRSSRGSDTAGASILVHAGRRHSKLFEGHRRFVRGLCPLRYIIVVMSSAGLAIMCGLRASIGVAFIAIINYTAVEESLADGVCPNAFTARKDSEFAWDATTERVLRTSFNLGILTAQMPGAFMALKSSTKWTVYIATLLALVSAAVFPVVVWKTDWGMLSFLLLFQGFCAGIIFPCMITIITNWAHPNERSTFSGILYAGLPFGYLIGLIGIYAQNAVSWSFNFTYMLLFALPWVILWPLWSNSSPVTSELVTHAERASILNSQRGTRTYSKLNFPFRMIRESSAFWVLACAYFGVNCMYYMLLFEMPHYFREVLLVHYDELSVWLLPPIMMFVVCVSSGILIDFITKKKNYDMMLTRKTGATIGMMVPAFCLLGLSFMLVCKAAIVMILLTIAAGTLGVVPAAILVNHMDLSPNFAGALVGVTGTLANIPQFVIPTIMGSLLINGEHFNVRQRWTVVFTTISLLNICGCIVFIVWGKGDVQPWNIGRRDSYNDPSHPSVGEGRNLTRTRSVGSYGSSAPSGSIRASDSQERAGIDKMTPTKTDVRDAAQETSKKSDIGGMPRTSYPQSSIRTAGAAGAPGTPDARGTLNTPRTTGTQGASKTPGAVVSSKSPENPGARGSARPAGAVELNRASEASRSATSDTPGILKASHSTGTHGPAKIPNTMGPRGTTTFVAVESQATSRIAAAGETPSTSHTTNVPSNMAGTTGAVSPSESPPSPQSLQKRRMS